MACRRTREFLSPEESAPRLGHRARLGRCALLLLERESRFARRHRLTVSSNLRIHLRRVRAPRAVASLGVSRNVVPRLGLVVRRLQADGLGLGDRVLERNPAVEYAPGDPHGSDPVGG